MPIAVGETFERYQIESLIGRGGMGEVYRASDTRLRRKVALKVLRADRESAEAVARLFREARAAAVLAHPNTVAIHDIGEHEGHCYIVMELVSGQPLLAYVGDARVPAARKLGWLVDVASALGAAHKAGVIHRDVKPSNVMVSDDDVVKVLDFGLARPTDPVSFRTQVGHVLGTPRYMAAEVLAGAEADARSDQYAFGLTAYELLSGKHPGGALAFPAIPTPLHEIAPELSPAVSNVIARTLSPKPEDRFESMDAVALALEDAVAGRLPRDGAPAAAAHAQPHVREPSEVTQLEKQEAPATSGSVMADTVRFGSAAAPSAAATTTRAGGAGAAVVANLDIVGTPPPDTAARDAAAIAAANEDAAAVAKANAISESSVATASVPPALGEVMVSPSPMVGPHGTLLDPNAIARASGRPPEDTLMSREKPAAMTAPNAPNAAVQNMSKTLVTPSRPPNVGTPRQPQTKPLSDLDVDTMANAKANAEAMAQLKRAMADDATAKAKAKAMADAKAAAVAETHARGRSPVVDVAVAPSKKFPTVAVVIVLLGLCAFAGAYYGSKELTHRGTDGSSTTPTPPAPPTADTAAPAPNVSPLPSTNILPLDSPAPVTSPVTSPSTTAKTPKPTATPRPRTTPPPPSGLDMKLH